MGACKEARSWADGKMTWAKIIGDCVHPEWIFWLHDKVGLFSDKELRLMAVQLVKSTPLIGGRKVYDLLDDERSREVLRVAVRFANGRATSHELDAAWAAAWDAAWAAARAAARAAAWAAAWDAARAAAGDAARAAAWDAAGDAARAAAGDAARAAQAKYIKRKYGSRIVAKLNKVYPIK